MSFTQSCFIRKNTPELRSNLEKLGISVLMDKGDDTGGILVQYGVAVNIWSKVAFKDLASNGVIDCGENEDLFLALAALRDDDNDDYMQYFTDGKGGWLLHEYRDKTFNMITGMYEQYGGTCIYSSYHKATPKEIVEHFKTER